MKQQLVIKEAFGENISRALQETVRCSCLRNVCLLVSSEVNAFVCFLVYFPTLYKAGAHSHTTCPTCAELAAQVQPGLTDEHWWMMLFRQTHVRRLCGPNPLLVCGVFLDDGISCYFAKCYFKSLEVNITSKDAKCKYSWVGFRFSFLKGWKWVHEN